jgi:ubiquinone/menaquinone biosynthesis C-methylase UbiE
VRGARRLGSCWVLTERHEAVVAMAVGNKKAADAFPRQLETLLAGREDDHPADIFRDVDDDFWFWANTAGRDASPVLAEMLPGLPDPKVQTRWTGKAGFDTLKEGFAIYRTMRDLHNGHFGNLRQHGPVLDFGCGFGRVIRYFMKDVPAGELIGTDVNDELINFCVASNPWCRFTLNDASPSLAIADNEVGYLYAYSVFSHFSEPMHEAWLAEFKRVLRPGGVLALTVRPRSFIEHCGRLRSGAATGVSPINKKMFLDTEAELARYDKGEFCFSPYDPDDDGAWWGEACISRSYVEAHWSKQFTVIDFVKAGELKQHLVLLQT